MVTLLLLSCATPAEQAPGIPAMSATDALTRVSLDLRGVRPSADEVAGPSWDVGIGCYPARAAFRRALLEVGTADVNLAATLAVAAVFRQPTSGPRPIPATLNALKLVGKRPEDVTVVVVGAGAAGVACTEIMLAEGVGDVIVCNRKGALVEGDLAGRTNKRKLRGTASEVMAGADVVLGLSGPGAFTPAAVRTMADGAIVFAMANPVPEVQPEDVHADVAVMATGRSEISMAS